MKLNRNLFYILFTIFVASVCIVVFLDSTSVMSRVGTGLMTGSFMGMIGAAVNYAHIRSEYFSKFATLCWDVVDKLRDYQVEASVYNDIMTEKSKEKRIKYELDNRTKEESEQRVMEKDFEILAHQCFADGYAPFFFHSSYQSIFDDLCDEIKLSGKRLCVERMRSRMFWILGVDNPPKTKTIVIGDSDEFYEETFQKCRDYHDMMVFECYKFATLLKDLCNNTLFSCTIPKSIIDNLELSGEFAICNIDITQVRDVRKERMEKSV